MKNGEFGSRIKKFQLIFLNVVAMKLHSRLFLFGSKLVMSQFSFK